MNEVQVGEYRVRRPRKSDREALAAFSQDIWPDAPPHKLEGRWWWNDPIEPQCFLAEHTPTGAIAAMCGERRTRLALNGEVLPASCICDWDVSPSHKGRGLGRLLVEASRKVHSVMYTTSISESAAVGFKRLGWKQDSILPAFVGAPLVVAGLSALRSTKARATLTRDVIRAGEEAGVEHLDTLWTSMAPVPRVMMVRDAAFLRSHLALVPHRSYSLAVAHAGGGPVGYMLYRVLPAGSFRRFRHGRVGLISDFLLLDESAEVLALLVRRAALDMIRRGAAIMAAVTTVPGYARAFTRLGFASSQFPVLGKYLNGIGSRAMQWSSRELPDFSSGWHITFADNDMDLIFGSAAE